MWDLEEVEAMIEAQRKRERWYKPGVWMLYAARRKARSARFQVRMAWQRVFRGWDDSAVWSLDDHLAKSLGEQLVALSKGWGYPDGYTPEEWKAALAKHGTALLAYRKVHYDVDGDEWEALYMPAQEALRWVADNFCALWD